ncbi:MAG: ABC transporter ATP-binding protein [Anaerolineales bacterium]|nr:ABC transporter ATP-binding protein [Chloroflexota bacterium]MBL6982317.1 ABC transporter ATP-binding protein [Anaerolineales bacterium]
MNDIAIRVNNLSKRYRIGLKEEIHDTFAGALTDFFRQPVKNLRRLRRLSQFGEEDSEDIIWALKDVSFEVKRGEVVGIIGRNGAGKSTLLKILSRITHPTGGRVTLDGRVSSLLEVGTGFHPELTGRDNIYLNGTILGMTKTEIDKKFDEIVDFSGVEKFIDTPVKRYSSGMGVRLAFSVAAHLEPQILLVDEVLAVGDAEFQKKCLGRMGEVAKEGQTVLFVSHNMSAINRLCQTAIHIDNGRLVNKGDPISVISAYLASSSSKENSREWHDIRTAPGDEYMRVTSIRILGKNQKPATKLYQDQLFIISITYQVLKSMNNANIGFEVNTQEGVIVLSSFDADNLEWSGRGRTPGMYTSFCEIPANFLNANIYYLTLYAGIPFMKICVRVENVLKINIEQALTNKNPVGRMGKTRSGVVAPNLQWHIHPHN